MRIGWASSLTVFVVLALLLGCARTSNYVRTGAARPERPEGCEVAVFMTAPQLRYTEIGVVEFSVLGGGAKGRAQNVAEAKERAAQHVCKEGGNAIILQSDGRGSFVRATVIATAAP
jgi:hypothetical protein